VSRYRRAISPVISTVILVAVAIVISVSAAFYLSGTTSQYTGIEKIEIPTAYCILNPIVNNSRWAAHFSIKNSGPTPTRISYIMVNDVLISEYNISEGESLSSTASMGTSLPDGGITLESGETVAVDVWIGSGLFSSGTSISVKIHSTSGFDYVKLVKLS
jgi:archaeal type IV pilus assembly protein PilA